VAQRKIVTALFTDVVGSTSLAESHDPETLRNVLSTYFEEARATVERHGGSVEKFIGDAVVALFGVPAAHEDDALRALRAADELRTALARLNESFARVGIHIDVRMGVNTGEVIVDHSSPDGFRASGDTMNVAARLEQGAGPGEILVGALTRQLGGDAIEVEPLELEVKGKAQALDAYRLLRVVPDAEPYPRDGLAPLVGRDRELEELQRALDDARDASRCVVCTVVGPPGVGKSRLVREFVSRAVDDEQVLVGRCPSYGEGVTFMPLADALGPVLGDDPHAALVELLEGGGERSESAAEQVEVALGLRSGSVSPEEAFSALRAVLESLARRALLVLVIDDLHWAEPRLLDFLEYLVAFSSDGAILLLCPTRPELVDDRPSWSVPREHASFVTVRPLADAEAEELVGHLLRSRGLGAAELGRVVEAADGNPLFLEQLLALNADVGPDEQLVVPPTIHALLAARLDQLDERERPVLEAASIEGRVFHRDHVEALLAGEAVGSDLSEVLLSLARRQLIRPARGRRPVEAFAFAHGLVRDAAYASMPKERRARLHVRLAEVLESQEDALEEIIGLHLADAVRLRRELGHVDEESRLLASRAARLLLVGGERALGVGDDRAAVKLLERAVELVGVEDEAGRLACLELGRALAGAGRLDEAGIALDEALQAARSTGERALELRAFLALANLQAQTDATVSMAELAERAEGTLEELEQLGDERGLALAWWLLHWTQFRAGQYVRSGDAAEQAIVHAVRAGDRREELRALGAIAIVARIGPTTVDEGFRVCDEVLERARGARLAEAFVARARGGLLALTGDFERGREECRRSVEIYEELGHPVSALGVAAERERVERLSGDLEAAERELRAAHARLEEIGDIGYLSWIGPMLARVLARTGRSEEAIALARSSRARMQPDHAHGQIVSRLAEATALAAAGERAAAETIAKDALELAEATDAWDLRAEALLLLADLDEGSPREREEQALALFEAKGDLVSSARLRERLSSSAA
jgi:class 3 adenylate cyclase/tetratricopeptide (TPR) repeat protein